MFTGRAQSLMTLAGAVGTAWVLGCMPTTSSNTDGSLAMSQAGSADSANGKGKTTICHIPPGNPANAHTITVGNAAVTAHLAHGDKLGRCEDKAAEKPKGPCPDKDMGQSKEHNGLAPDHDGTKAVVCHIPPGNPANAHTIVVGIAAVKAHLAHGDKLGACKEESTQTVAVDCGGDKGGDHVGGPGHTNDGGTTHPGGNDHTGGGTDSTHTGGNTHTGGGTDTTHTNTSSSTGTN